MVLISCSFVVFTAYHVLCSHAFLVLINIGSPRLRNRELVNMLLVHFYFCLPCMRYFSVFFSLPLGVGG